MAYRLHFGAPCRPQCSSPRLAIAALGGTFGPRARRGLTVLRELRRRLEGAQDPALGEKPESGLARPVF
ncbi:MAG TPA: hypothetical protein VLV17_01265 [Anaeromyxobacteraceae bacterium]|nr:hypothetical protein [Anaeromyxobacteraceae bacterium]